MTTNKTAAAKLQEVRELLDKALWERKPGTVPKPVEKPEKAIMKALFGIDQLIAQQEAALPVSFLLDGERLKLSFQEVECESCGHPTNDFRCIPLDQYKDELQGAWVALVPADNDKHLTHTIPKLAPASAPEITNAMAIAFHNALTDGSIGQSEIDEIKTGLRAAFATTPTPDQFPDAANMIGDHFPDATKMVNSEWLSADDMAELVEFYSYCEDCDADGYLNSKETMRRLAELGAVRHCGAGRYQVTSFGRHLIDAHFEQKVRLPLHTIDEANEASRLAMEARINRSAAPTPEPKP